MKAGVDAWERGEFDRAIAEWRDPAAKGDPDAQFNLGQAYKLGRGVPMDLKLAESWYKKAADKGHIQAADNYGLVLFQDNRREEAMPYIRASSARGEPRAQYVLGTAMFNGDIAEKDWVQRLCADDPRLGAGPAAGIAQPCDDGQVHPAGRSHQGHAACRAA